MTAALDPLFRPRSVAFVGASRTVETVGEVMVRQAALGGLDGGQIWAVNPRYDEIHGVACYESVAALPAVPDHVVIALGDSRVEAALAEAIDVGARAVTIYGPLAADGGAVRDRVRAAARAANIAMLGGNAMGCYSFHHGFWNCGFETRTTHRPGRVALITQSGSVFYSLVDADERLDLHSVVGPGQELIVNAVDALHDALDQQGVETIALFLESVRDPAGLVAAFARAAEADVPVVVCKVGRTEQSNRLALTHSGALAGNDAAFDAVCRRHGVRRVESIDELFATTLLFDRCYPLGPGAVVAVSDSGGERGLLIDLAADLAVPFAELASSTTAELVELVDEGVEAVNPLDAWSTGANWEQVYGGSLAAMLGDAAAAIGVVVADRGPGSAVLADNVAAATFAASASAKPVLLVSNHQGSGADPAAVELTRAGIPVLDGLPVVLRALRHLLERREYRPPEASVPEPTATRRWTGRSPRDEIDGLEALHHAGHRVATAQRATTRDPARAAAERVGYPVALKTLVATHKTDVDGVRLALDDAAAVAHAYDDIAARLGPAVSVAEMIDTTDSVEMLLGLTVDPEWGPLVTVGFGGVLAEVFRDSVLLVPPCSPADIYQALDELRLRPLLDGVRGRPAVAIDDFCGFAARFSEFAVDIAGTVAAIDVNPVLVSPLGSVAVDALFVARTAP